MKQIIKYVLVEVCLAIVLSLVFQAWFKVGGGGGLWLNNLAFVTAIDFILSSILIIAFLIIIKVLERVYPAKSWRIRLSTLFGWSSFVSLLGFIPMHLPAAIDPHAELILSYAPLPGLMFSALALIAGIVAIRKEEKMNTRGMLLGVFTAVVLLVVMITTGGSRFLCVSDKACTNGASCVRSFNGATTNIFLPGVCFRPFNAIPVP